MAESVDTRIVEAKFDSSQFEEGVNKTVKKLEELKKSLNLKDTETTVTDLASKTSEATGKMSSSLEQLENRLTTFTGMLKNKLLSGIADEVVSSIYRIKNSFESLVTTLSTGQISYGLNRYTEIMGSVRTLTFSGVDQSVAYDTIERLGTYADQTSYSLDQLVSTMSKFKTAGADLDTAERMVIGASNAAASMGVNATDAARAYLNLQQAYSKGYMQQNDWQSFESLPMVGTKFNQAILDAAVNIGTLEKQADGTYKTINKIDKTVKTSGADSKGITAENLGTKLSSKWFTKKVMEEVFGSTYYFNVTGDDASETISGIKDYEKAMKTVGDGVKKEQENLQEQLKSKSITDEEYIEQVSEIMGSKTYSEIVSKGLEENAPSSEEIKNTISGYLKENADKLEDISYDDLYTKQFEAYLDTVENKQLEEETARLDKLLAEEKITIEEYNEQLEEFKKNNNLTQFGWEAFRAGQEARSFTDVLNTLKDTISRGWATSFELIIGKLDKASEFFTWLTDNKLANAIYAIGDFRNAVLEVWAGGADDEGSGRSMLITTLETLDDLIGRILSHFAMFSDDEDAVKSAANSIGQNLTRMTRNLRDFVDKVNAWFTEERITKIVTFVNTVKTIIGTVSSLAGAAAGFATSLLATLWPVFEAVVENISKIITRVSEIFNTDDANAEDGLSSLQTGFENILLAVEPLVKPLTDFVNILGEIGLFFAEMFAGTAVSNLEFFADTLGFVLEVLGMESSQSKAEKGVSVLEKIKNSVIELGTACKDTFNFVFDFFRSLYDDLRLVLGMREAEEGEEGGFFTNIVKFFETSEFIKNVKAKFTEVWQTIDTFFFGEEVEKKEFKNGKLTTWTERSTSEFSKMIDSAIKAISTFATKTVPKYAKKIWENVTDFLFGKKIVAVKYNNGQYITTYTRFKSGFSEFLDKVFKAIKTFIVKDLPKAVSDVWNKVVDLLFGKKEIEDAVNGNNSKKNDATDQVKGGFSKWLTQAIESVKSWIVSIPGTIKSLWNTIIDVIFYRDAKPDEINPDTGATYAPNTRVLNAFAEWVKNIPNNILEWLKNDLPEKAAEIWDKVIDFIFGKDVEPGTVNPETGKDYPPNTRIKEGFSAWLATAVQTVKDWVKTAKETIAGLWDIVLDSIFGYNDASDVNRYTTKKNGSAEKLSANAAEGIVQTVGSSISEEFESDNTTRKGILETARTFIENLGIDIGKLLAALPTYIVEGWNFSLNIFKDLAERITGWLKTINLSSATEEEVANSFDNPDEGSLVSAIVKFGQSIVKIVTEVLPPLFKEGWTALTGHADDLWNAVKSIFGIDNEAFNFDDLGLQAEAFGKKVADAIRSIPGYIRTAIEAVKKEFTIEEFDHQLYDQLLIVNSAAAEQYRHEYAGKQRNGLWEAIKSIFGSFGDLVKDLGPDILEGINSLFTYISQQLVKATDLMTEAHDNKQTIMEALDEKLKDENGEDRPLWAAMKTIGQTIKDAITTVIPNFISEGIEELKLQIPKYFSNLFGGNTAEEVTTAVTNSMKEGIIEKRDFWSSAGIKQVDFTETMSEWIGTTETLTTEPNNVEPIIRYYRNRKYLLEELQKELDDIQSDPGKYYKINTEEGFNEFVKRKEELKGLIEELNSPELSGNTYVEVKDDGVRHYQAVSDLWDNALGDRVKILKSRTDTIRELHENNATNAGYKYNPIDEEDVNQIKLLNELNSEWVELTESGDYKGVGGASSAVKQEQSFIEDFGSLLGNFGDILTTISESDTVKVVAICVAAMYALSKIQDLLSVTDEVEASGYTAKWKAIEVAIIGIVGLVGWITYLSSDTSDAGVERLNNTMDTLGKIADFITSLAEIIKVIVIASTIKEGVSFLDDLTGGDGGIFSTLFASLGKFAAVIFGGKYITSAVDDALDEIGSTFIDMGSGLDTFMISMKPAIESMASVKDTVSDAITAVQRMGTLISEFYKVLDLNLIQINNPGNADSDTEMVESTAGTMLALLEDKVFDEVQKRIELIFEITTLINNLSNALKTMEDVENPAKAMGDLLDVVSSKEFEEFIKKVAEVVNNSIISKYTGMAIDDLRPLALGFEMIGNALSIFSSGTLDLTTDKVQAFRDLLDVFSKLAEAFKESGGEPSFIEKVFVSDNSITKFGRSLKSFSTYMKGFFTNINNLPGTEDEASYQKMLRSIEMVTTIAQELSKVTYTLGTVYTDNFDRMDVFGQKLPALASNISTFANAIDASLYADIDDERLTAIFTSVSALGDLASGIADMKIAFSSTGNIGTWLDAYMEAINANLISGDNDFRTIGILAGQNLDSGLAIGIEQGKAVLAAKELANAISGCFTVTWEMHSPSKLFEEYGMYMDEGLAQGIAKYSYDPLAEAGDMADSLVDKMRRVLANPNAPDSLKAQVQNLLDNMVDEGTYNQALEGFGAKLGEDAGQTMRAVTEEEMKKAAEANQSSPGFLDYVTLAWNKIWNTDSDIPGFKSRFVQNAENIIDGTWGMLKDKIVEGANKVGPTFTETVMGILAEHEESSWELDESAFHLLVDNFNVLLGAALTDLKDNSTSAIKKKGIDLFGEIMNAATDESQGGNLFSRIGNVFFGDIKDYINQNKYVAMARSVFSNIFNAVKDESSENSGVVATTIFDSILSSTNAVSGNSAAFDAILGALHSFWDTAKVTMEQDLSLTPQVAPQLVLTDQFMADASKISQLVGGNINPSVLSGLNFGLNGALNTTLDMANQLDTPTTFDYTAQLSDILHKISDMNSNVKAFDTALRNTRFVINGDRLTDVIGPSMDEWLGREGFYVARRNAT